VTAALAQAYCAGIDVASEALAPLAARVDLPTYAFQRRRYWLPASGDVGDVGHAGLLPIDHPILGAAISLADKDEWVFTGRLSTVSHPWLGDHTVFDGVLFPGAGFVELALAVGARVGAGIVDELVLEAPMNLDDRVEIDVQIDVEAPGDDGRRPFVVASRAPGEQAETGSATIHARGILAPSAAHEDPVLAYFGLPPDEEMTPGDALYDELAARGLGYGPAFQGVRRMWRDGADVLADVRLPADAGADASRFGMHPALLDAALHAALPGRFTDLPQHQVPLPFSFNGVRLSQPGVTAVEVRIVRTGLGSMRIETVDETGAPVLTVESLRARPVSSDALIAGRPARRPSLYEVEWIPVESHTRTGTAAQRFAAVGSSAPGFAENHSGIAALLEAHGSDEAQPSFDAVVWFVDDADPRPFETNGSAADAVRSRVHTVLTASRSWLRRPETDSARLVVVTCNGAGLPDESPDLAAAATWGLLRSAQSEHPGRIVLVDNDIDGIITPELISAALDAEEAQLAVRAGGLLAPRLSRRDGAATGEGLAIGAGAVLITGGTGGLGALVARHLVATHGARDLVLVSRRGEQAHGVADLVSDLAELGARTRVLACDVGDRGAVRQLLDEIADGPALTAVVHAAGVLADGTVDTLTPDQVNQVLGSKAEAALHLHELTLNCELSSFVMFSSMAAVLGSPGQGNYAAANSVLDALARRRVCTGLPAVSVAWGPWDQSGGMTAVLSSAGMDRLSRMGVRPLTQYDGLALLDLAGAAETPCTVAVDFDTTALSLQARTGLLPSLLESLAPSPRRAGAGGDLARELAGAPPERHDAIVLNFVRHQVAAVLGHASSELVDAEKPFSDLGFDSLGAVEFRNRLVKATGLSLPSTLVFDYPTSTAIARLVRSRIGGVGTAGRRPRYRGRADEPIAIVGMACRYPGGVRSADELWDLVARGSDATGDFPADRGWDLARLFDPDPDAPGTVCTRRGGFLHDAGEFDAGFFGIGPREALAMDPQQRLLLEVSWEALEHAGIDPASLRGSDAGVYTGAMYRDYEWVALQAGAEVEGYVATGTAGSVMSGRVAYSLGLEGPALTVDTACSSSLVALHLACQALRAGESSLALVGGVTVMATPTVFVEFSRQGALSADGRCKAFSAAADGAAWSEGAAVVVAERLSDAQRLGHTVLAVVRGTAVNQDGASNGLTAPNGPSQERVIAAALASAGLRPVDIDAVEAHGTGTALGDPIEARALIGAYGPDRPDRPLWIGALKSNIGHTQAASGVGGVIKMVQALRHEILPRTLHVDAPSPYVDWSGSGVELLTEARAWPAGERVRRAGVSSFGISGTNAHVILEEPPATRDPARDGGPVPTGSGDTGLLVPLVVSAQSEESLRGQASRLRAWLAARPEIDPRAAARSLLETRARLDHRGVVVGRDWDELLAGLAALASGTASPSVISGAPTGGQTAFLFTGQGAQRVGMGSELYGAFPVFRAALDEVCACMDPLSRRSIQEVMFADSAGVLDRTEFTQPALFAFEVALLRLLESFGVVPDMVLGHSIGELTAAYAAGVWSLPDACALVAARGRVMGALPPGGAMLSVAMSEEEVAQSITAYDGRVSVAAVNGPASTVLSGDADAIGEIGRQLSETGVKTSRLRVSHAFHSALMDPMLREFHAVAAGLTYREPTLPIVSNISGVRAGAELLDPKYWVDQVRSAVRFAPGVDTLVESGVRRFVEVGPDAVLTAMTRECLAQRTEVETESTVMAPCRRSVDEQVQFVAFLGRAFSSGMPVEPSRLFDSSVVCLTPLPTYAFAHRRYWAAPNAAAVIGSFGHPFLTNAVSLAGRDEWVFTGLFSVRTHPWITDHAVFGSVLLPGAAFVEFAAAAGRRVGADRIAELVLQVPLVVGAEAATELQLSLGAPGDAGRRTFAVHSRPEIADGDSGDPGSWVLHASGVLTPAAGPPPSWDEQTWPPAGADLSADTSLYDRLAQWGLEYGPAFQGVTAVWRRGEQVFAEISLDESVRGSASSFGIHPALLDACLHVAVDEMIGGLSPGPVPLPFAFTGVRLWRTGAEAVRVRLVHNDDGQIGLEACDDSGSIVLTIDAVVARPIAADALPAVRTVRRLVPLSLQWIESLPSAPATPTFAGSVVTLGWARAAGIDQHYSDIAELNAAEPIPDVIVWSPPPFDNNSSSDRRASAVRESLQKAWQVLRSWLATEGLATTRLVVATYRAAGLPGESVDLASAAVAGMVRSARSEHPGRVTLLDYEGDLRAEVVRRVIASDLEQVAIRGSRMLVPRLMDSGSPGHSVALATGAPFGTGTVLVTGGTGGLGAVTARHLAAVHGIKHLLLISRRGDATPGAADLVAQLAAMGAQARVAACDVADRAALAAVLDSIESDHPLTAVIHCAGVIDDATIENLTPQHIDRVSAPKIDGALHLDELTGEHELSAFIVFSSIAAMLGAPGQGNYAAANSFLDGLARDRRARGLTALSVAWGPWTQDTGMLGALDGTAMARLKRLGMKALDTEDGTALLDATIAMDEAVVACVDFDRPTLSQQMRTGLLPSMLGALAPGRARRASGGEAVTGGLVVRLAAVAEDQRDPLILGLVREHAAAVLGYPSAGAIAPEMAFNEMGFDSLGSVELRNRLVEATGLTLPSTLVFDHPNAGAVARFLRSQADVVSAGSAIDDQVDTLRSLLTTMATPEDKQRTAARIRAMLTQVLEEPGLGSPGGRAVVQAASADELFVLIDRQIPAP